MRQINASKEKEVKNVPNYIDMVRCYGADAVIAWLNQSAFSENENEN